MDAKTESKLAKIYYSPKGYWRGLAAIKKLSNEAGVSESTAKAWLQKQAIWQIYLPPPRKITRPQYENNIPNDTHSVLKHVFPILICTWHPSQSCFVKRKNVKIK